MRLTLTAEGLTKCVDHSDRDGRRQTEALAKVLEGDFDPKNIPSQIQQENAEKVTWLVDSDAAANLSLIFKLWRSRQPLLEGFRIPKFTIKVCLPLALFEAKPLFSILAKKSLKVQSPWP